MGIPSPRAQAAMARSGRIIVRESIPVSAPRPMPMESRVTKPNAQMVADGRDELYEREALVSNELFRFVRRRAEEDLDGKAGPLFALLLLSDLPVPRSALETYVQSVFENQASARGVRQEAAGILARVSVIERSYPAGYQEERDDLWAMILDLARRTLRP